MARALAIALALGVVVQLGLAGPPAAEPGPRLVRVLSFNVLKGGGEARVDHVVRVVEVTGANLVGLQEAEDHVPAIAARLGFDYDERASILSRFPIAERLAPFGVRVRLPDGRRIAVFNLHLSAYPFGPDLLAAGAGRAAALANEADHLAALEPVLRAIRAERLVGVPVILLGDFNVPSHLDGDVPWPVSRLLAEAGLADAYRGAYPDPLTHPGHTWSPRGAPGAGHRIDFVYYQGLTLERSFLVGGPLHATDLALLDWPSDHRAVLALLDPRSPRR